MTRIQKDPQKGTAPKNYRPITFTDDGENTNGTN